MGVNLTRPRQPTFIDSMKYSKGRLEETCTGQEESGLIVGIFVLHSHLISVCCSICLDNLKKHTLLPTLASLLCETDTRATF